MATRSRLRGSEGDGAASRDTTFLVAEQYTIADIGLYAYTHVAEEGGFDLSMFPAIGTWLDRVAEQPGYVAMMA